jgi:hypothetical protein
MINKKPCKRSVLQGFFSNQTPQYKSGNSHFVFCHSVGIFMLLIEQIQTQNNLLVVKVQHLEIPSE